MSEYGQRTRAPALYNSYPPSSSPMVAFSANGLSSFQAPSHLPNPLQPHNFHRTSQGTSNSESNGTRYTTQPFLQPPPQLWPPQDTWSQSSMSQDTRSGRQNSPPFDETKVLREVVNFRGQHVSPEIHASIPKGFFEVEGKWTCYRRNYFPVLCSFSTKPHVLDGAYYLQKDGQQMAQITQFAISISAKTAILNNQESQSRGLVQHTPKRDKATESTPGKVIIQPTTQMSSEARHTAVNSYSSPHTVSPSMISHYEPFPGSQQQSPPTHHTFERIQFQKATANNGKRRAQQQFFHVVVELWADIGRGKSEWVEIATRQSAQMVVRGRSPGHYKDNGRRDSTASMDPDRDTGSGGDSTYHSSAPTYGSHSHSNGGMEWTQAGSNHHYGSSTYRQQMSVCSPESEDSSGTFTESHTEIESSFEGTGAVEFPFDLDCELSTTSTEASLDRDPAHTAPACSHKRLRLSDDVYEFLGSSFEIHQPYQLDAILPTHLSQPVLSVS